MQTWAIKQRAFTIVELLIVIVVIAILASVTVVAYSGIQTRAKLTSEQNDLNILAKATKLYVASGGSFNDGAAGANNGLWYGGADGKVPNGSYTASSMREVLQTQGFLPSSFTRNFMIALCTNSTALERVVMIRADPVPSQTAAEQIAPATCTNSTFSAYTDPAQQYKMNMVKLVGS